MTDRSALGAALPSQQQAIRARCVRPTAGFVDFEIASRTDVYAGAEQSSSAAEFGTLGITFRARKATNDEEWQQALATLSCDIQGS